MPATRLTPSRIDLPDSIRQTMASVLNSSLVTVLDLYSQVKMAHWVVKGPQFIALHGLFDELAVELAEHGDTVAERITALAGTPTGTARQIAAQSPLPELPAETNDGLTLVRLLAERYALYAQQVREASDTAAEQGDASTADLFTGLSRDADKRLWFLEAHLQ